MVSKSVIEGDLSQNHTQYLVALGLVTQGYRALDEQTLAMTLVLFDLSMAETLALVGDMDPTRRITRIDRLLAEEYRDPEHPTMKEWGKTKKMCAELIRKRNDVVHARELRKDESSVEYLRLGSAKPTFRRGEYNFHNGFSTYTYDEIKQLGQDLFDVCNRLRGCVAMYQEAPPEPPQK